MFLWRAFGLVALAVCFKKHEIDHGIGGRYRIFLMRTIENLPSGGQFRTVLRLYRVIGNKVAQAGATHFNFLFSILLTNSLHLFKTYKLFCTRSSRRTRRTL